MARPIDEFALAWVSLSGSAAEQGWRSIPVSPSGHCLVRAGRRFPGNLESLLIGFPSVHIPVSEKLPEGQGFIVERMGAADGGRTWLALTRQDSGDAGVFAAMVNDVVALLDAHAAEPPQLLLLVLLRRVRAWQEFMRKGAQHLSLEAEVGLVGELCVLQTIIEAGVSVTSAVTAWTGPLDGLQDFELGTGALEVKATIAASGFPATIRSLEQLDDSVRQPLFLAGVRLCLAAEGIGIQALTQQVRHRVRIDAEAARVFDERLLASGYLDAHADRYTRRFAVKDLQLREVAGSFPRLTPSNVPAGVLAARYEIDLGRLPATGIGIMEVLTKLGVL